MDLFSTLKGKITQGIEDKIQSVKLSFIDKTSSILGYFTFIFTTIFLALSILIFLGIGLGEVLADVFDSRPAGYFATAGIYFLLILLLLVFKKGIVNLFAGIFISMLTMKGDDEDDDNDD